MDQHIFNYAFVFSKFTPSDSSDMVSFQVLMFSSYDYYELCVYIQNSEHRASCLYFRQWLCHLLQINLSEHICPSGPSHRHHLCWGSILHKGCGITFVFLLCFEFSFIYYTQSGDQFNCVPFTPPSRFYGNKVLFPNSYDIPRTNTSVCASNGEWIMVLIVVVIVVVVVVVVVVIIVVVVVVVIIVW